MARTKPSFFRLAALVSAILLCRFVASQTPDDAETLIIPTLRLFPSQDTAAYCHLHYVGGSQGYHGALQFSLTKWGPYTCKQPFVDALRLKCTEKLKNSENTLTVQSRFSMGGFCTITFTMKDPSCLQEVLNTCFKPDGLENVECERT